MTPRKKFYKHFMCNIQKLVRKKIKFMAVSKIEVTGMLDELLVESRMIVYADRAAYLGSSWVTRRF